MSLVPFVQAVAIQIILQLSLRSYSNTSGYMPREALVRWLCRKTKLKMTSQPSRHLAVAELLCRVLKLPAMGYHVVFFWESELARIHPLGEWRQSFLIPACLNSLPLLLIYHRLRLVILRPFSCFFSTLEINLFGPLDECSLLYFSPIKDLHQWPSKRGRWPQWDIETL